MSDDTSTDARLDALDEKIKRYRSMTDTLRNRSETTAKAVGGLGLSVVTAIGLTHIGDIYPLPPGGPAWPWDRWSDYEWALLAAVASLVGFVLMIVVVVLFSARLWRVQRPMKLTTSEAGIASIDEYSGTRQKAILEIYRGICGDEAENLEAYETRGAYRARAADRLEARGGDATVIAVARREAAVIGRQVELALALAGVDVVRDRTTKLLSDGWAYGLVAMLAAGILMFAVGTDYLSSERTDTISIAKACADARTAKALPHSSFCTASDVQTSPADDTQSASEQLLTKLREARDVCAAAGSQRSTVEGPCAAITDQLVALERSP